MQYIDSHIVTQIC